MKKILFFLTMMALVTMVNAAPVSCVMTPSLVEGTPLCTNAPGRGALINLPTVGQQISFDVWAEVGSIFTGNGINDQDFNDVRLRLYSIGNTLWIQMLAAPLGVSVNLLNGPQVTALAPGPVQTPWVTGENTLSMIVPTLWGGTAFFFTGPANCNWDGEAHFWVSSTPPPTGVPEPSSFALGALGAGILALSRLRRRRP